MKLLALLTAPLLLALPLQAANPFPTPRGMDGNVQFWLRVYTEWPTNRYAIHDDVHLDVVYRVVASTDGRSPEVKAAKAEVEAALGRLDSKRPRSARGLKGAELEAYQAWSGVKDPARFRRARGHVRHQKGQADRFREALHSSGRFRPQMEAILVQEGVPRELIALVFVESMFNYSARSYSGAVGLWQFMSYTGREYLNINKVVDERRDPIIASYAASNYLRTARKRLGAWPVAITSYNYGMNGMARAVKSVGTRDLAQIFKSYRSGSLGFAAKNYYTEFLAALEVVRHPEKYFPGVKPQARWRYDVVRLPGATTVKALEKAGAVTAKQLKTLNPALSSDALRSRLKLPAGLALRVPRGKGPAFVAALGKIRGLGRDNSVVKTRSYTVRGGDSIIGIARRHGVRSGPLLSANNLARDGVIHPGQKLKIPPRTASYTLLPEARGMDLPELPAGTALAQRDPDPKPASKPPAVRSPDPEPPAARKPDPPPTRVAALKPRRARAAARRDRQEKPGLPTVRRARVPGGRVMIVAGPALACAAGPELELEAEIAVDVLTGRLPLPSVDAVSGPQPAPQPLTVLPGAGLSLQAAGSPQG